MSKLAVVSLVIFGTACGDDGQKTPDAPIDAAPDADASMCGAETFLTGELVDWDSTSTEANFCGVFGATFTVRATPTEHASTAPNGRYELCATDADPIVVDITMPTAASPCDAMPGTYMIPAQAYFPRAVLAAGATFSARAFTAERAATFFSPSETNLTYDPTKSQVFVHVSGGSTSVVLDADGDPPWMFDGTHWAPTTSAGTDFYFPNVQQTLIQLGSTTTTAKGLGAYTLQPGRLTYITISL